MSTLEIIEAKSSISSIALKDVKRGQVFQFVENLKSPYYSSGTPLFMRLNHSNYYIGLHSYNLYTITAAEETMLVVLVRKATLNVEV